MDVTQFVAEVSGNFTTPSGVTAYASGDIIANSGTAGSVTGQKSIWALREARGALTPHGAKTWTISADIQQN